MKYMAEQYELDFENKLTNEEDCFNKEETWNEHR